MHALTKKEQPIHSGCSSQAVEQTKVHFLPQIRFFLRQGITGFSVSKTCFGYGLGIRDCSGRLLVVPDRCGPGSDVNPLFCIRINLHLFMLWMIPWRIVQGLHPGPFAPGSYVLRGCPLVIFITFPATAAQYTVSDSPMTTRTYVDLRRQNTHETGENHE